MAVFPGSPMQVTIEAQLGGVWTDISPYALKDPVTLQRGKPDESTTAAPSELHFTLTDVDGRFASGNPAGPYYPNLARNTRCRASIPRSLTGGPNYLRLETDDLSYASAPDSAALQITSGILSVRVDCKITDWVGNHVLFAKWGATAHAWALWTNGNGTIQFGFNDGTTDHSNASPVLPYFGQRIAIRVDYNIGLGTVQFFTAPTMAGTWTPLGAAIINPIRAQNAGVGQIVQVGAGGVGSLPGTFGEIYEALVQNTAGIVAGNISGSPAGTVSTSAGGAALAITWASNPTAGQKIIVAFQTLNTVSTVKDNGTSVSTFSLVKSQSTGTHTVYIYEADGISLPGAGSYTVTVTFSAGAGSASGYGRAYSGAATGTGAATSNSGTSSSVNTSAVSGAAGNLYFAAFCDESGLNPETISLTSAGFTTVSSQTNGASFVPGAAADFIDAASSGGISASWTLGDSVAWAAVIATFASAATVTTAADPVFSAQTSGVTSFSDAQSNTWTLAGTSELSGKDYRVHVELPQWPQEQDPTGHAVYTRVQGGGLLRRITQRQTTALSPMTRAYTRISSTTQLAGQWPAEDGLGSAQIASGIGGPAAQFSSGLQLASFTGFVGAAALPVMNGASIFCPVPNNPNITWTSNNVRFLIAAGTTDTNGAVICQFTTTGTIAKVQCVYGTGGNLTLNCFNAAGTNVSTTSAAFGAILPTCRLSVQLINAGGGNIQPAIYSLQQGATFGQVQNGPTVAGTIGAITGAVQFGGGLVSAAMGQFSVQAADSSLFDLASPLNAWFGETAGNRVSRLCREEGYQCRIIGPPDTSMPMGYQSQQTIAQMLQECADADLGMLFEPRQQTAIGYRTRASIGNQPATVNLSFASDHLDPWEVPPLEDDQIIVNDVTVQQTAATNSVTGIASSARYYAQPGQPIPGGALSALEPGSGWNPVSHSVTSPGAAATIAATATVQPGIYTVYWIVTLAGTVGAGDANNFGLFVGNTQVATSVNTGTAGTFAQTPVSVTIPAGGAAISVQSIAGGTAGAIYTAIIPGSPGGVGRYDQTYPVNVANGSNLADNAGARLYAGTVNEPRYPGMAIDLNNTLITGLTPSLAALDIGDRLTVASPATWLPPGPGNAVDEVLNGYSETLFPRGTWKLAPMQCVPYAAYPVGLIGDPVYGWIDTDGHVIAANATFGAGTILVSRMSPAFALASTNAADYPVLLICQGMVLQISGASGAADPQTLTVASWGVNGVSVNLTAGSDIRLAYPANLGF